MTFVEFFDEGPLSDENLVSINLRYSSVPGDQDRIVEERYPVSHKFELSVKQLIELDSDRNPQGITKPLIIDNGKALLMVQRYSLTIERGSDYYISGEGILFTK